MSSAELKERLIRLIDGIKEEAELKYIYQLVSAVIAENSRLEESLAVSVEQISQGHVHDHDEVMNLIQKKYTLG